MAKVALLHVPLIPLDQQAGQVGLSQAVTETHSKTGKKPTALPSCHFHPSAIGQGKSHWPSPKVRGQEMHSALRDAVAGGREDGAVGYNPIHSRAKS